jgi:hypothetical protein
MNILFGLVVLTGLTMIVLIYRSGRAPARSFLCCERLQNSSCDYRRFALSDPSDISSPETALLWATQISALQFVSDREPRGVSYTPLKLIYLGLARTYPELHDGFTFHHWVGFYVRLGLFRFEDDAIHLTRGGYRLLEYLDDPMLRETASR